MRTLIGILVLALLPAAGCTADEPADDTVERPVVTSNTPAAEPAATGSGPVDGRTLVHPVSAVASDTPEASAPVPLEATATTGEPWLAGGAWATIVADPDDDPRLETVAERVPTNDTRTPLALQVVAERPSRPHDHTDPGTE